MTHKRFPDLIRGYPGEAFLVAHRPSFWTATILAVAPPRNGIDRISAQILTDKKVVEETAGDDPLGNRIVRELVTCQRANLGVIFDHASSSSFLRPSQFEVGDVAIQISFICL